MKTGALLAVLGILSMGARTAIANDSIFTKLDLDRCKTVQEDQGGVILTCPGLKGYPVLYKEGDLRPSLFYGPVSPGYRDGAFESFSSFATVNTTIEWRIAERKPVAAILRFFIANSDPQTGETPEKLKGQVLVVSKVATRENPASCVVGMVDALANRNANELARDLADAKAAGFECGKDTAGFTGIRGPLVSEFSSTIEAGANAQ